MSQLASRRRRLIGFMAVVVSVSAFAVWQARVKKQASQAALRAEKVLDVSDATAVREIRIDNSHGHFRFQWDSPSARWLMTEPLGVPADQEVIQGLLKHLIALRRTSVVGTAINNLELFGLAPPWYKIGIAMADGRVEGLEIGKPSQFNSTIYIKRSTVHEVLLADAALEFQVNKPVFEWRDKRVLEVDADAITRIKVTRHGGRSSFVMERSPDGRFRLQSPPVLMDRLQVNAILGSLSGLNAAEFVVPTTATKADAARFNLITPDQRVEIDTSDDKVAKVVLMSRSSDGAELYAMTEGDSPIARIASPTLYTTFNSPLVSLRDNHLMSFETQNVARIELKQGHKHIVLVRDTEMHWRLSQPVEQPASDSVVLGLLYKLGSLASDRFVVEQASAADLTRYQLASPVASVALYNAEASLVARMDIGPESEGWYPVSSGLSQPIVLIPRASAHEISFDVDDYKRETKAPGK